MAKITREDVLHLAKLARIELSEDEISRLQTELESILGYVEQLRDVDVTGLAPTTQVSGLTNVMRPDQAIEYASSADSLLGLAPSTESKHIKVKRMVE